MKPRAERAKFTEPALQRCGFAGLLPAHIFKSHHLPHRSVQWHRTQQDAVAIGDGARRFDHRIGDQGRNPRQFGENFCRRVVTDPLHAQYEPLSGPRVARKERCILGVAQEREFGVKHAPAGKRGAELGLHILDIGLARRHDTSAPSTETASTRSRRLDMTRSGTTPATLLNGMSPASKTERSPARWPAMTSVAT